MKVLVTDYAWSDLDMERSILDKVGAALVVAKCGSENELEGLAADVDAGGGCSGCRSFLGLQPIRG